MKKDLKRREFIRLTAAGSVLYLGLKGFPAFGMNFTSDKRIMSPGCRTSKVKVARLYMGNPQGLWPKPGLDFKDEIGFYETRFGELAEELADVDFVVDRLVSTPEDVIKLKDQLKDVDGILVIHLTLEIASVLNEILSTGKPVMVFAVPYSGHEWSNFGALQKQPIGLKWIVSFPAIMHSWQLPLGLSGPFTTSGKQGSLMSQPVHSVNMLGL